MNQLLTFNMKYLDLPKTYSEPKIVFHKGAYLLVNQDKLWLSKYFYQPQNDVEILKNYTNSTLSKIEWDNNRIVIPQDFNLTRKEIWELGYEIYCNLKSIIKSDFPDIKFGITMFLDWDNVKEVKIFFQAYRDENCYINPLYNYFEIPKNLEEAWQIQPKITEII